MNKLPANHYSHLWTRSKEAQALEMREQGMHLSQIAEQLGCSATTVQRRFSALRKAGITQDEIDRRIDRTAPPQQRTPLSEIPTWTGSGFVPLRRGALDYQKIPSKGL